MHRPILLTGFEPFLDVATNPTSRLVLELDGREVDGVPIVGRVLPVTYASGPALAVSLAESLNARLVIGFGVASNRKGVWVEAVGRRVCGDALDNDGVAPTDLGLGPEQVSATVDVEALASSLGAQVSRDAGSYVCNAWAWTVPQKLRVPAAFVHVPDEGVEPEIVLRALSVWVRGAGQV